MPTAAAVIAELKKLGSPKKAAASAWFFKTGKGQYGHGDIFFGVTVPEQRVVAKRHADLTLPAITKLLQSKIHECRQTALLILVRQYQKANLADRERIVRFYLANKSRINNWDLVDVSAPYILGDYLVNQSRNTLRARHVVPLQRLARSKNLWERRIAIVATYAFIRNNEYGDTLKIAEILLTDAHDLIHKAVGWMLREVGKRSLKTEEKFLKKFAHVMPRTMLRYAIEKFPEAQRKMYLSVGKKVK